MRDNVGLSLHSRTTSDNTTGVRCRITYRACVQLYERQTLPSVLALTQEWTVRTLSTVTGVGTTNSFFPGGFHGSKDKRFGTGPAIYIWSDSLIQNVLMRSLTVPLIELDTPPPSPTPWITTIPSPTIGQTLRFDDSPVRNAPKKRQKRGNASRKRKRSDPTSDLLVTECDAYDITDAARDTDSYPLEMAIVNTEEIDEGPPVNNADQLYTGYVDAVLVDNAPFYQISRQVFVVSGWNVKEGCNSVRWADLFHS